MQIRAQQFISAVNPGGQAARWYNLTGNCYLITIDKVLRGN